MPLEKPPLATVEPGRPITAQGWNAIVDGLAALYDAFLALGTGVVEVRVTTAAGEVVTGAEVVAAPAGEGQPVRGLPMFQGATAYRVVGLTAGEWRVHVRAAGFRPTVTTVTVPTTGVVEVTVEPAGVTVPDLFGMPAQAALATLRTAGIEVDLVFDALGREVSRVALPPQYQNVPVLVQSPDPGTVVDPATQRVRLVLAAVVQAEPTVTMPSLVGLSQQEVIAVLDQLGLRLGRVTQRSAAG